MDNLVKLGVLLTNVIHFFVTIRSERIFILIRLTLLVFGYSTLVCVVFDQLAAFFQQSDNSYLYEDNGPVFLLKTLSMSPAIYSITFLTLGLLAPWVLKRIKGDEHAPLITYIYDIKSNKWLAYFFFVISIYVLYSLPVNHLYDLDGLYAYINPAFSYSNRFTYEFMRLALPFLTIIGVYLLACIEKFTFKALFGFKNGILVLVLALLIFHSLEEMLIGFVNSFITTLFGFLFQHQLMALLFFGGLKLIIISPLLIAKLVAIMSTPTGDSNDQTMLKKSKLDDELLDVI